LRLFPEALEPTPKISQKSIIAHRIDRIHMVPPHLLVAFGEIAFFIVLSDDVADELNAQ
jgi:uracil-DNA glycosylase